MKSDHGKRAREPVGICISTCPNKGTKCDECWGWSQYNGIRCAVCGDRLHEGNVCEDCYELGKYVLAKREENEIRKADSEGGSGALEKQEEDA